MMTVNASASSFIPDAAAEIVLRDGDAATSVTVLEEGRFIRRPRAYWADATPPDYTVEVNVLEALEAPEVAYALQFVAGTGPGLVGGTTILSSGIGDGFSGAFKVGISGALLEIVPRESDLYVGVRLVVSGEGGRLNLSARLSEVLP